MTPFRKAEMPKAEIDRAIAAARKEFLANPVRALNLWGLSPTQTLDDELKRMAEQFQEETVYTNNLYQVHTRRIDPKPGANVPVMVQLSVRRLDREPIHDWRHLQQIKNELVGDECEEIGRAH